MTYKKHSAASPYLVAKNTTGKKIDMIAWSGSLGGARRWADLYAKKTGKPAFIFKLLGSVKK